MRLLTTLAALCTLAACSGQTEDAAATKSDSEPVDVASVLTEAPADVPSPSPTLSSSPAPTSSTVESPVDEVACQRGEDTIFSCKIASGKRIAVCGTASGKAEYRFGAAKPELVLQGGQYASVAYSGGGEQQIAFENGATRYVVFSRVVRTNFAPGEPNYPAISDGVIVQRKDKVVSVLTCGGPDPDPMPVQTAMAEKHMERQNELFTYETGRADPVRGE